MTADTITLPRAEYEALIEELEDAKSAARVASHLAQVEALGLDAVIADGLPLDAVQRLIEGASPITIWREHRGLSGRALAKLAKLQPGYLHEIENGVKRGSIDTYRALATALAVTIDDLI